MDMDYIAIGRKLRELREARGLTQTDVGNAIGLTAGSVSNIEYGKYETSIKKLDAFASVVGAKLEVVVLGGEEERLWPRLAAVFPHLGRTEVNMLRAMVDTWEEEHGTAVASGE